MVGYERNCEMSVGPSGQDLLPQIEDESTLDGEVGKRLNQSQMVAVPVSELTCRHCGK